MVEAFPPPPYASPAIDSFAVPCAFADASATHVVVFLVVSASVAAVASVVVFVVVSVFVSAAVPVVDAALFVAVLLDTMVAAVFLYRAHLCCCRTPC